MSDSKYKTMLIDLMKENNQGEISIESFMMLPLTNEQKYRVFLNYIATKDEPDKPDEPDEPDDKEI